MPSKKKSLFKNIQRVSIFSFFVLIISGVVWLALYSNALSINRIEIHNDSYYPKDKILKNIEITKISRSPLLAILGPDNILFWNFLNKSSDNFDLSGVSSVNVSSSLLRKTVTIEADKGSFWAVLCKSDGECYTINRKGKILNRSPKVEGSLVLKIILKEKEKPLTPGKNFLPEKEWTRNISKTIDIFKESSFVIKKVVIEEVKLREWKIVTPRAIFHFDLNFVPENLKSVLEKIKNKIEFSKTEYLDFRVKNRLYYK
ncbi:MAG: hypothetical protein ABEI53_03285 [Candidatus Magasanikbacteria bacterium]